MEITPAAIVVLPLAIVAAKRRMWALALLVGFSPFYSLTVIEFVGHQFPPHEIALLGLLGRQVIIWTNQREITIDNKYIFGWLIAFSVVCILSVIAIVFSQPDVLVHQYNAGSFATFSFKPLVLTTSNVSQLFLRLFFVGSVFTIASSIKDIQEIRRILRWIVLTGVLVGIVGVFYQVSNLLHIPTPTVLHWIGFTGFPKHVRHLGPLPRMFSLPGEPGFTGDYLLYTLSIVVTTFFVRGSADIFTRKERVLVTSILAGTLLLSTGTTAYGGLGILAGVLATSSIRFKRLRITPVVRGLQIGAISAVFGFLIDVSVLGGTIQNIVMYQLEKITFGGGSGSIRLQYMMRTLEILEVRPLLGVGVGSHHIPSLLFTLTAEVGVIGLLVFLGFHFSIYRRCGWLASREQPLYGQLGYPMLVASITLLLTNLIAKSIATLLFPWYWFSLALPFALIGTWRTDSGKQ